MSEAKLDLVGCVPYSPVQGARANDLPDQIPDDVKQDRWNRFMAHQQAISTERLAQKLGREIDVLLDEVDANGIVGRSSADAPEIDGNVLVHSERAITPGHKVRARVIDLDDSDLYTDALEVAGTTQAR